MKKLPDVLIVLSVLAVVVSAYVSVFQSEIFKLAGTQWMLIAIAMGIYALYAKGRAV